ncbi:MAG TPA: hypothetical protein VFQ65_14765 [Kofleriaceae bacterium]|nr:hypothetical protein [Kofleriaceae bacterium]
MRTLVVASLVVSVRVAAADPEVLAKTNDIGITAGAGEEQIGKSSQGTLTAGAHAAQTELTAESFGTMSAESNVELRSGSAGTDAAANITGKLEGGFVGLPERPVFGVYATAELGSRPSLDARRDVGRAAYASSGAGFKLAPSIRNGTNVIGIMFMNIAGSLEAQADSARATYIFDVDIYYHCRLRTGGPAACLHVFDTHSTGVSGGTQAVVSDLYFARWTGLDLGVAYGEIGVGVITDTGKLGISDSNGKEEATVTTQDLPLITVGAYDAALATMVGPIEVTTRAKRSGYVSLDGDMSIEDRAALTAALRLATGAKLSASAFVARTHWWTSKTDPGSHADTGGGELALDLAVHDFDVHASTGVARSFYAVLDGSAPDAPALGFRSAIDVKHAIKNWIPR